MLLVLNLIAPLSLQRRRWGVMRKFSDSNVSFSTNTRRFLLSN